jgi:hypothetical protein
MDATPTHVAHALRGAANLRQGASSVAPVAYGYARSLRPSLAWFSRAQSVRAAGGNR